MNPFMVGIYAGLFIWAIFSPQYRPNWTGEATLCGAVGGVLGILYEMYGAMIYEL